MRIVIQTDRLDHDRVRELVRYAFADDGLDGPDIEVHVKRAAPSRLYELTFRQDVQRDSRFSVGTHENVRFRRLWDARKVAEQADWCAGPPETIDRPASFSGLAYHGVPAGNWHPTTRYAVTLKVPEPGEMAPHPYAWHYHRARTVPPVVVADWDEHLLHLAAHEARHVAQYARGAVGAGEVDAEEYARGVLTRWRAEHGRPVEDPAPVATDDD